MALAAPAIMPANGIAFRESWGKGEMMHLEMLYEVKRRELMPAIPSKGLAIPGEL
jgi:hypothetical protein